MTNFQFLQTYVELQKDIMFDELRGLGFGVLCYNKIDPSPFWNNILVGGQLSIDQVAQAEIELKKIDRKAAFFFENSPAMKDFIDALSKKRYTKAAEDSLMFHDGSGIVTDNFESIQKVSTAEDLDIFMKTFDQCYRADDPLNPYGELGEYIVTAKISWEKHHETNRLEYFVAYKDTQPVAVAALTNFNGIGYLSNIGSLVSVRGQGFGKAITNFCLAQSVKNGNHTHCLATEEGTNPNTFYQSLGFKTKFTARLMVKN